jgi:hypothetical protein
MFKFRLRKSQRNRSRQDFEFEYLLFLASAIESAERQALAESAASGCESTCNAQSQSVVANTAPGTSS